MKSSVKLRDTITVGSTHKKAKANLLKIDTNKVFNEHKCVLHLVDMSAHKVILYEGDDPDDKKIEADNINCILTDQHIELWKMMKRGDLIEDISSSGFRSDFIPNEFGEDGDSSAFKTNGRFIVDSVVGKDKLLNLVRNGLIVKDLYRDIDKSGTVLSNMFTVTDFPPGYFDDKNLVVNDYLCPGIIPKSCWHSNHVYLDTKKLKIRHITNDNIFRTTYKTKTIFGLNDDKVVASDISDTDIKGVLGRFFFDKHYLYLVISYKKTKYLLYGVYSDEFEKQNIPQEMNKIIRRLNKETMFLSEPIDVGALKIAIKENVDPSNALNIF